MSQCKKQEFTLFKFEHGCKIFQKSLSWIKAELAWFFYNSFTYLIQEDTLQVYSSMVWKFLRSACLYASNCKKLPGLVCLVQE